MVDVRRVDADTIGWSNEAFRMHLLADAKRKRWYEDRLALAVGAQRFAEEQARSAVDRARKAAFWAQWGFWIGVASAYALAGTIAGVVAWALR